MASILKEYTRAIKNLQATPPERMAVKSTSSLLRATGRAQGAEQATATERGTSRMATENALEDRRRDIRQAKKDAGPALALGVANLGLQGLSEFDRIISEKAQEERDRITMEKWDMIQRAIASQPDRLAAILRGDGGAQPLDTDMTVPRAAALRPPASTSLDTDAFNEPPATSILRPYPETP